jgi:hypothetical protein
MTKDFRCQCFWDVNAAGSNIYIRANRTTTVSYWWELQWTPSPPWDGLQLHRWPFHVSYFKGKAISTHSHTKFVRLLFLVLHSWVTWSAHLTMLKSDSHNLEIQSGVYGLGCHLVSLFVYCISSALAPPTCHVLRCQDQLLQIVKQIQSLQSFCNSRSMEHTRVCAVFSPTDKTSWWDSIPLIGWVQACSERGISPSNF